MCTKEHYLSFAQLEGEGTEINLSMLARLMLEWETKRQDLDDLEDAIKDLVLHLGETQTTGNVRATYNNPRNSYDYEGPCRLVLEDEEPGGRVNSAILEHTKMVTSWKSVCEAAKIEPIVTPGTGPGSVTLKLLKP